MEGEREGGREGRMGRRERGKGIEREGGGRRERGRDGEGEREGGMGKEGEREEGGREGGRRKGRGRV